MFKIFKYLFFNLFVLQVTRVRVQVLSVETSANTFLVHNIDILRFTLIDNAVSDLPQIFL